MCGGEESGEGRHRRLGTRKGHRGVCVCVQKTGKRSDCLRARGRDCWRARGRLLALRGHARSRVAETCLRPRAPRSGSAHSLSLLTAHSTARKLLCSQLTAHSSLLSAPQVSCDDRSPSSLLGTLDRLGKSADTSSSSGVASLVSDTALALLRKEVDWISAALETAGAKTVDQGEQKFGEVSARRGTG
eukprot:542288-Rhodomonas_salina.1